MLGFQPRTLDSLHVRARFLTGFLALATASGAAAEVVPRLKALGQRPPATCPRQIMGMSGLCLLANAAPAPRNRFVLTDPAGTAQTVPVQRFVPLAPGTYRLAGGTQDQNHELSFVVQPGLATTIPLVTLRFHAAGRWRYRFQHFQRRNGIDGRGCHAEVVRNGALAVLPGVYQLRMVSAAAANEPGCMPGGITFNAAPGTILSANAVNLRSQTIPPRNSYVHPDGSSALTSISAFQHPIVRLSLLPNWRSHGGIHNPFGTPSPALVLTGIGSVNFIVPFEFHRRYRDCGISLAQPGLPAHVLMTECRFRGQRLAQFRVNSGAYVTYNSRHGMTAIEGNYLNSPIQVNNVRFALAGGSP